MQKCKKSTGTNKLKTIKPTESAFFRACGMLSGGKPPLLAVSAQYQGFYTVDYYNRFRPFALSTRCNYLSNVANCLKLDAEYNIRNKNHMS